MVTIPGEEKAFTDEMLAQPLNARVAAADPIAKPQGEPACYAWVGSCFGYLNCH